MKPRLWTIGVIASVTVGTLMVAAPAQAADSDVQPRVVHTHDGDVATGEAIDLVILTNTGVAAVITNNWDLYVESNTGVDTKVYDWPTSGSSIAAGADWSIGGSGLAGFTPNVQLTGGQQVAPRDGGWYILNGSGTWVTGFWTNANATTSRNGAAASTVQPPLPSTNTPTVFFYLDKHTNNPIADAKIQDKSVGF